MSSFVSIFHHLPWYYVGHQPDLNSDSAVFPYVFYLIQLPLPAKCC